MVTNMDRYMTDLDALLDLGTILSLSMGAECNPAQLESALKKLDKGNHSDFVKDLPSFRSFYQSWYSEAKVLIKQLLPDRLSDFINHYQKPKPRKDITFENYRIYDYLQGATVSLGLETLVGPDVAIPHFAQQMAILQSVKARFKSSLFEIRMLVQADLFDSELEAARELAKNKFTRAAGALAGVVLERHLSQVCDNHVIKVRKKAPGISDLNNILKEENIIDIPQWRFIQHLADIRNLCDHSKSAEPTAEQVNDLITGVMKITKSLF